MSTSMDGNRKKQEESGPYIWLRYASQYTKDGRTHTVEMSVPVPLGASVEEREQLFNEAEAGMQQLTTHMDQRLPKVRHALRLGARLLNLRQKPKLHLLNPLLVHGRIHQAIGPPPCMPPNSNADE
ncbi:hypothetical protein [Dictyobacter kobayashii]|uniref:Uncharacterized protein n=1 Tax=Dictyobacter kobayashii TaxID=2014872 RepID=A0A402AGL7_9CHLR|nr:hypothetical protein [Dictyobacter kobayashii]GCE18246.1 hypothetical protein KDK_20460 [Dictyobacter kobayashii]